MRIEINKRGDRVSERELFDWIHHLLAC